MYRLVTHFHFKYQFHDHRESKRNIPLRAKVPTEPKPQITYFLWPPPPETCMHTDRCRPARRHLQPHILTATDGRPWGRAWETCVRGRAANWLLRSGARLHKGTSCSFQVSGFASLRTNGDTKQQWHLWQVMIPLTKNLDNDIPRPFVAVKITVAHSELHVCPPATCAGAWSSCSHTSAVSQCWSGARESRAGWNDFSFYLLLIQPACINWAAHTA